jgi:hypothetical protein
MQRDSNDNLEMGSDSDRMDDRANNKMQMIENSEDDRDMDEEDEDGDGPGYGDDN